LNDDESTDMDATVIVLLTCFDPDPLLEIKVTV
jgi:hypothetical protein